MNRATVQSLGEWRGKHAGSMPASASNMLALPFCSATSQSFLNACELCRGERDHSGRSGWHVASQRFRDRP